MADPSRHRRRQSNHLPPATPQDTTDAWNQFYGDLGASINAQMAATYPGPVILVEKPHDFLWFYEANGLFNQGTFDFISGCVSPSQTYPVLASLSVSGGLVNEYVQVLAKIVYQISSSQTGEIQRVTSSASVQGQTIVADYQALFGPITPALIAEAQAVCGVVVQTPLDYVISYVLGAVWSSRLSVRAPLLTNQEMQNTASEDALMAMLPLVPPSGKTVVADVWTYLQATASVAAVQSQAQMASWLIAQLLANTARPSPANGSMRMVDPVTGVPLPNDQVRYSISRPVFSIQEDLANSAHVLTATAIYSPHPEERSLRYTIEYPGYTWVPIIAAPWSNGNMGWFLAGPIASAYGNQNKNITGYHFIADPGDLQPFPFGGTFGMVTNLFISGQPIVTTEEIPAAQPKIRAKRIASPLENLALLRPLGLAADQVAYTAQTRIDRNTGHEVTVYTREKTAALAVGSTPILMQTAYVMGCTISNPASTT